MATNGEITNDDWRAASKRSFFRWPGTVGIAGTAVCLLNLVISGNKGLTIGSIELRLFDALWMFSCLLVASLPIWYYVTSRLARGEPKPAISKQFFVSIGLLVLALLITPRFEIEYRDYDSWSESNRRDFTTTVTKRSIIETFQMPLLKLDELTWLQSNYSAAYIPAQIFCPRRSTRLYPFFGISRSDYLANALAPSVGEDVASKPPAAALASGIARCNKEGPAMLAAGNTKESALLRGDIDRFFFLNSFENPSNKSIVLEDSKIPAPIMAKIELALKAQTEDHIYFLEDSNFDPASGQVRRLTPLVLAEAMGRTNDYLRLRTGK